MISAYLIAGLATGTALMSRTTCLLSRTLGGTCIAASMFLYAGPALADQTLMVSDNSRVECIASSRDLTRVSLIGDEVSSVSKVQTGNPQEDFSVVNEPVRGDIYLSVPDGFTPKSLSFFATSKKGYVYKFVCRIEGNEATQIFLSNPAIASERANDAPVVTAATPQDQAVKLVQAMYSLSIIDGYQMRQPVLNAVHVGDLKVQMIAEYRGDAITGRVLRIENKGAREAALTEATVAPASSLAVSIAEPKLAPGKVTTAYLVSRNGN